MEMNHILIVEDDKDIREAVAIYLKSQGYEVFQAGDGVEGLEMLERCEELWICGDRMSAGMKREAAYAKARGIPVRRIPVCEIMGNQTVQEMGEAIREGPDTSQSHQKNVQFGM